MSYTGLEKIIEKEKRRHYELRKELENLSGGALHIRKRNGSYLFCEYKNRKQIGITRNKERIYQLARKKYLECAVATLEGRLEVLENAQNTLLKINKEDGTGAVCEYCKMLDLSKVRYSPKELEWVETRNSANPYKRESLKYATRQGVMTRSKSERLIGNALEERGVVYVTEPEIVIDGKTYYPDFMVLRTDGTSVIWEHFGLMEDKEYFVRALAKIEKYRKLGYVPTKNLICTFEEDLENMDDLNEIIDRFVVG